MNNPTSLLGRAGACAALVAFPVALLAAPAVPPRGLDAALDFAGLPYFKTGTQLYQFSSTDPAEDQFRDYGNWLRTTDDFGSVLADISGPGTLHRIWSTGNDGTADRIQIYLDGAAEPVVDSTLDEFHSRPPLRDKPQVGTGGDRYLAWWSYLPISFEKSCRVVRRGNFRPFYSISYHTYTTAEAVRSFTGKEDVTALERIWSNPEADPKNPAGNVTTKRSVRLQPGESSRIFEQIGAGHVASIRIAHYSPAKGLKIRMFWDGDTAPAVDAPLKWFFGSVDNGGDLRALGVGTVGQRGYCHFPMPFWKSARIELANLSDEPTPEMEIEIQYNPRVYEQDAAGYFRTFVNEAARPGDSYTCLRAQGRGHVVGMAKRMPAAGHACEADEIFYIDDRRFPDIYGTGEEDYNNCAWWHNLYNSYPTHGCVGNDCYYRLHFPDLIVFEHSIAMEFEAWQNEYIASLVWYYAKDTPAVVRTDTIDVLDEKSEAEHDYRVTGETWREEKTGTYPGRRVSAQAYRDSGRSFNGASEFTAKIDPANRGVRLRVRTEHVNFQRVAVSVDGVTVAERPWSIVKNPFDALWVDADFEIPAKYTAGKAQVRIKLAHVAPYPNWIEYRYDVFSYR